MNYVEPKQLYDSPESLQSGSGSVDKENIDGGFNVYDNVLKLVDIQVITFSIADVALILGAGSSSTTETIYHELGRTPFVEIEWEDPSFIGSGGQVIGAFSIGCTFNDLQINLSATFDYTDLTGSGATSYPGFEISARILIYDLNTKRRLDTYVK